MIYKKFQNPARENRPIGIKITKKYISFHFPKERNREFYWFMVSDWKSDIPHWENHLLRKAWFSEEMKDFIHESIEK